jgi:hypothetical protein
MPLPELASSHANDESHSLQMLAKPALSLYHSPHKSCRCVADFSTPEVAEGDIAMRYYSPMLMTIFALILGLHVSAADDAGTAERIEKLVAQLGSNNFQAREDATKQLDSIGLPALEALKNATQSSDAERRRRAEELVSKIEKRQESARLLAPTKITLRCKDMPLAEAVAELAKKSGQQIVLSGDQAKAAGRTVSVEIVDATFWQALDQLCQAAGLIEASTVEMPMDINPKAQLLIRRRIRLDDMTGPSQASKQIALADGKFEAFPTHWAGAARVRALPPKTQLLNATPRSGELLLGLSLGTEARLPLQRVVSLHIDKAMDDQGQKLESLVAGADLTLNANAPVFIGNINGMPQALMGTSGQQVPVRLKVANKASKLLKELSGVIAAEVRTPPEPLMTVDNILKAAGKTAKGPTGGSLTVHEVARQDDGQIKVRVELEPPTDPNTNGANIFGGGAIQIRGQGIVMINGVRIGGNSGGDLGLSLVDAKCEKFLHSNTLATQLRVNNNVVTHEATLLFKPQPGQGEPAKLVYTTTRPVIIEIPFTLKDVPLP